MLYRETTSHGIQMDLHVNRLLLNIEEKSLYVMKTDYILRNISLNADLLIAIIFLIFSVDQYRCIRIEISRVICLIYECFIFSGVICLIYECVILIFLCLHHHYSLKAMSDQALLSEYL